ncbi:N-acetyltransferase [Conexibacter sp. SYSU D00693]|uniref:GNAT family N-acetyltransferase n=1 Tax=Conexibacter sp. SYSU D00693 TaxID=2812560 RepID=UPI00196A40D9|nr:GNAT family N-acetyltransferase [Conexibacter sp. SYSU D00693]
MPERTDSSTTTTPVRPMRPDEGPEVAGLLALALRDDPFIRWIAAGDHARATRWMSAGLRMAQHRGLVLVDDGLAGAAVLMGPGAMPLPMRENAALLPALLRAVGARRVPGVLRALTRLEAAQPPEPHWTGLVLGVHPALQGTGVGRAIIEAALARTSRDRVGTYLEVCAGGPHALYRRFGFTRHATVDAGAGAPVMETMWRPA